MQGIVVCIPVRCLSLCLLPINFSANLFPADIRENENFAKTHLRTPQPPPCIAYRLPGSFLTLPAS